MSENVFSSGYMAPILNKVDRYALSEELYDKSVLQINYEGSLVFSDGTESKNFYGIRFDKEESYSIDDFVKECEDNGISVYKEDVRHYTCYWYNGVDSDMSCLKLAEFYEMTK